MKRSETSEVEPFSGMTKVLTAMMTHGLVTKRMVTNLNYIWLTCFPANLLHGSHTFHIYI